MGKVIEGSVGDEQDLKENKAGYHRRSSEIVVRGGV